MSHYLTRAEFALCVITGVTPNDYVQAKLLYLQQGNVLSEQIVQILGKRPGIGEVMAYII